MIQLKQNKLADIQGYNKTPKLMEELRNKEGKKQLPLFEMGHLQWVTHSGRKDVLNKKSYFTGILKTCFSEKGLAFELQTDKIYWNCSNEVCARRYMFWI